MAGDVVVGEYVECQLGPDVGGGVLHVYRCANDARSLLANRHEVRGEVFGHDDHTQCRQ